LSLRIQVCGRVAIERDDRRLEGGLPGRQGRLLFAYLIVHRLRPLTRDELTDALWGDAPPDRAERALSALLSKLRRVLATDWLAGTEHVEVRLPGGALVDLELAEDALHRAESAVAQAEWARAWGASQVALNTARRGFLPGEDAEWARDVRRRLEAVHLGALEAYCVASLGVGGTELMAAERAGRELVVLAPYRESGHRCLMAALAREGNVAEALAVYEDLRRRLADELGTAPCAETRALHARLLRAGSAVDHERV
jgi:pentatricopeptide repeat protein